MVNIFIPLSDPVEIAKVLDYKRLGKQRVEALQIINIITENTKSSAWRNHPVVLTWKEYPEALKYYCNVMIKEWIARGYQNNMLLYELKSPNPPMPWFMNCKPVLLSYQASLLRKNPEYYSKFFKVPKEYMKYSYLWVVENDNYLTAEKIKKLKSLPANGRIKIKDYAHSLESL